jgi:hypothetical protein
LRLREISQLFNTLDPSPFRIRDISPLVDQYLVDWAQELPQGSPLRVVDYLGSGGDKENEVEIIPMRSGAGILRKSGRKHIGMSLGWVVIWRPVEIFL